MLPTAQVPIAVQTMAAPSGTARFAAGKSLVVTAEKDPARVYPHFDTIASLLESDCKIVRWNALQICALLAPVDTARKVDPLLSAYGACVRGDNLVSAANAIKGLCQIARCRPDLVDRIVPLVLDVEHATYATAECRNVAIGQALNALWEAGPHVRGGADVTAFIRRQRENPRAAVASRAERMTTELMSGG